VTRLADVTLAGFPHPIDIYLPSNATRAVVFLHGGGGTKEGGAANEIGIALEPVAPATAPTPDASWLVASHTAFILPQGQAITAGSLARTWSNHVMASGTDDVAFLTALAAALGGGRLDTRVPSLPRVYLAGHSNGGMMANRMWCEQPGAFDAYASLAGPASVQLDVGPGDGADPQQGAHPCRPAVARPYLGIVGAADTVIQTDRAWDAATWAINDCLQRGNPDSFVDPRLVPELAFHTRVRVPAVCGGVVAAPVTSADGALVTWSDCSGAVRLTRINGADHCVSAGTLPCVNGRDFGRCANSMDAVTGLRMRDAILDFFADAAP
jgi:polyhydroxybutyrate depolymerase